jgi:hypothetical protein
MTPKVRWVLAGVVLTALAVFVLVKGRGGGTGMENVLRPADLPPSDPSRIPQVLRITPNVLDFGEVVLGQQKTLTVAVENKGKKPVTVYKVVFSCPCLGGAMEKPVVPPGQVVNLNISFTGLPGKRSYHTTAGVITDEEGPSRYDVTVDGRIQQDFILEPETVVFGKLQKDATASVDSVVRRRDGTPFTIKQIKSPRAEFTFASRPETPGSTSAYRITTTARALRPGVLTESATVVTGEFSADVSPVLTLSLEVEGDFACTPPIALAAVGPDGRLGALETTIRHRSGAKVSVQGVAEGQERKVEYEAQPQADGSAKVSVRFKSDFPSGAPFGEFLITVDGQAEPLHLPYRLEAAVKAPSRP